MKLGKYTMVSKSVNQVKVNEITSPRHSGRYRGISIGRDKDGFFAATHRARSKSFSNPQAIPDKSIKFIESTG